MNACMSHVPRPEAQRTGRRRIVAAGGTAAFLTMFVSACGVNRPLPGPASEMSVRGAHQCVVEAPETAMPSPAALLEVDRLKPALQTLLEGGGSPAGHVLLTLWYDPDGVNVRRSVVRHDLTAALADSVQKLVFVSLRRVPGSPGEWGARLRIDAADSISLALEPRQYCPPRPRSQGLDASMAEFMGTGVRYRRGVRERTVLVGVTVHPLGYVTSARIVRGALPGGTLDRQLVDYLRQFSFYPASLDGIPVQGELTVPVRLRG